MSTLDDTENVFDLNEAIPETELLDNSIQKGRAQLSVKSRRQRPSRPRYRDSVSSTEGDDSLERKYQDSPLHSARSPLQLATTGSIPSPDSLLSSRSTAFSFDSPLVRRSAEDGGSSLAATPRRRYRQLTNATSQEALVTPSSSPSKSCPSSNCSPVYMRRNKRPDSEVLVSDTSPADPGSPTVIFDKKTKRRFLDLGVTLRRSYVRVRKDKSNRLSVGSREPSESPSRMSATFVPFSWFTESRGSVSSTGTPPCSPKIAPLGTQSPCKSNSQESALSEEFSPRSPAEDTTSPPLDPCSSSRSSHPYQTLSQSSDEPFEEPTCAVSSWTTQQVCQWLRGLSMEQYVPEFTAHDVDGRQLLQIDSNKMKGLGVNSSDRTTLKRRIKEIHTAVEKERKALDKFEKQKEKQQRKKDQEQRRN
ncbi:unnamed protein product [Arctogadus glacialis]